LDTETSNETAQRVLPGELIEIEPGSDGDVDGATITALDAIVGSYPELAAKPRVIIGTDDRVRVGNTTVYPWRAICSLLITAQNNRQFIGTGWLISPRTVVTAGHCVFMHEEGGWAKSIQVIPGRNDGAQPYGVHTGTALRSTTGWTNSKNRDFDYGAIILPSRPGDSTGYFGLAVRNDPFLLGAALNLSGYPGDKGGRQQWFMAQRPKSVSDRVITYDIDTMGGQSGSPVWVVENGQRYGVGIHTNGSSSGNSATRINSQVFNNLVNWKNLGL
jgi:glutamyl endopeptidase